MTTGHVQLYDYILALNMLDPVGFRWHPGTSYVPPSVISLDAGPNATVYPPIGGVIPYTIVSAPVTAVELVGVMAAALTLQATGGVAAAVPKLAYALAAL